MGFSAATPAIAQTKTWDCSAAALAWVLDSIGRSTSEDDAIAILGPSHVNASSGLLDATGAGVVAALSAIGVSATNRALPAFSDACGLAGSAPLMIGGVGWDHWTGVRGCDGSALQLANPALGWKGVQDTLNAAQFAGLGPFYGVWLPGYAPGSQSSPDAPTGPQAVLTLSGLPPWLLVAAAAAAVILLVD